MKVFYNILVGQVSVWQLEFMWTLTGLISQGLADLGNIPEVIFSLRWTISGHFSNVLNTNIFFLTLEWAQLLVSVLCWMGTIYSYCSQGHLNSCPLAKIHHVFLLNTLINGSCFSFLKQVTSTPQTSTSKASFSKVRSCQQEPRLSDKTSLSLFYLVVSICCFPQAAQTTALLWLFISSPDQLKRSRYKSFFLGCEWAPQAQQ